MQQPTIPIDLEHYGATLREDGRYFHLVTPRSQTLAFPRPPQEPGHIAIDFGLTAAETLLKLDFAIAQTERDPHLTPAGRAHKLAPERLKALTKVATLAGDMHLWRNAVANDEQKLFGAPAPTSAVDVAIDREIRDTIRAMAPDEKAKFFQKLQNGEFDRVVLALMRSPFPGELGSAEKIAHAVWHDTVRRREPEKAAELDINKAALEWGTGVLDHTARLVEKSADMTRKDLFKVARDQKSEYAAAAALDLFRFTGQERVTFARAA